MRKFEKVSRVSEIDFEMPKRSTAGSAGYDFYCIEDIVIQPYTLGSDPVLVPTGVKAYMYDYEFLMLVNRSSNPKKKKLVIPNSIGIIDSDYVDNQDNEGEMFFAFYNLSNEPVTIKKGEKLGQGIFTGFYITHDDVATGDRTGGFGSTGE
jgi:dUTP pyrophosphatase